MKADNIFRFISVRPPTSVPQEANPREEIVSVRVVEDVNRERQKRDQTWEGARKKVGEKIVESNTYYAKDDSWKEFHGIASEVSPLLKKVNPMDRPKFRSDTADLLKRVIPALDLDAWLTQREYREMKEKLWRSYYGNVLAVGMRPGDRAELTRWIIVFWLLEAANDDEFKDRAGRLGHARPGVPGEFFFGLPAAQPPAAQPAPGSVAPPVRVGQPPAKPSKPPVDELRNQLERYDKSLAFLQKLHARKRVEFKKIDLHVPEAAAPRAVRGAAREKPTKDAPGIAMSSVDLIKKAPWRLTTADVRANPEHAKVIAEIGIEADEARIPDVIARIESRMAEVQAQIVQMERQSEIISIGSVLTRAFRPRSS